MKNISNTKESLCKKVLPSILIVFILIGALAILTQRQVAYADTFLDNLGMEKVESDSEEDEEEPAVYATGCIPETSRTLQSATSLTISKKALPSKVDYTDNFPDPGMQGEQGSCVAWAVGYAAKSYLVNVGQKWGVKKSSIQSGLYL